MTFCSSSENAGLLVHMMFPIGGRHMNSVSVSVSIPVSAMHKRPSGPQTTSVPNRSFLRLYVVALVLVTAPNLVRADAVIYNNFAPGHTYLCCTAWTVQGTNFGPALSPAMEFVSPASMSVTQIDVALSFITGTNAALVSLWTDAGDRPGALLGSWSLSNFPRFGTSSDVVQSITGVSGIGLLGGESYWLQVAPTQANTWVGWNLNITNAFGNVYDPPFSQSNAQLGAFAVLGVSEPKVLPLVLTALLISVGVSARRKIR